MIYSELHSVKPFKLFTESVWLTHNCWAAVESDSSLETQCFICVKHLSLHS